MKKMFVIMNHKLTEEQMKDAEKTLGIQEFLYLPPATQLKIKNIDPEIETIRIIAKEILDWIFYSDNFSANDIVLIQTEYGITSYIANYPGLNTYYCTTKREKNEKKQEDGSVKSEMIFKHFFLASGPNCATKIST